MTNREVLIQSLGDADCDGCTVHDIACPYTENPNCVFDGNNTNLCFDCKAEWLDKEWEDT